MLGLVLPLTADEPVYSDDPGRIGPVVLHELAVMDGTLVFRVASGGCTDAAGFAVDAESAAPLLPGTRHYRLTVRRLRADRCKAFLPDGAEVALDLSRDAGLTGRFTVSVLNPVVSTPNREPAAAAGATLRESLLAATLEAIRLEADAVDARLRAAREDGGSPVTVDRLRAQAERLAAEHDRIVGLDPADYPAPAGLPEAAGVFDEHTAYGPVVPAFARELVISVPARIEPGTLLEVDGTSRSGPFYRLAGIAGDDAARLQEGRRYRILAYVVYRREYVGFIGDYYVYAAEIGEPAR